MDGAGDGRLYHQRGAIIRPATCAV